MANQHGAMSEAITKLVTPAEPNDEPTPEGAPPEEEAPETVEPVVEGDDAAAETEESDEASGEDDPEPLYEVSVGGEKTEVSLEDLRKGYMMESDYRRKTQEVASQRKELESELSALDSKVSDAEDVLKLEAEDLNSPEALELKEYDPAAYYARKERVDVKARKLEGLKTGRDQRATKADAERAAEEQELTRSAIPEWLDEEVLAKEAPLISQLWHGLDLYENPPANVADHRLVVISRKAALYDQIMSTKPEGKITKPKPKTATPGTATTNEEKVSQRRKETREKLRETGRMEDAVKALLET